MSRPALSTPTATPGWSPWRAVVGFGVVSLAADMVYEGARSVTGPLLASLGASAVLVGLVTGAGEALALVLRLVFGSLADRTGRYWTLTIARLRADRRRACRCSPLTPFLGAAGLVLACVLILAERTGKAVRSPAKSTLLAHAAGRGRHGPRLRGAQGAGPGGRVRRAVAGRGGRGAHRRAVAGPGGAGGARRRARSACWWCRAPVDRGSARVAQARARADQPRAARRCGPRRGPSAPVLAVRRLGGAGHRGPGHLRSDLLPPGPRRPRAAGRRSR